MSMRKMYPDENMFFMYPVLSVCTAYIYVPRIYNI